MQAANPQQAAAANADPDLPLLVIAGAGTGKTSTLINRVRYLIERGAEPSSVLILTFTAKAAKEARERLLQSGVAGVGGSTFHALGARVLRQFYKEAGYRRPPTIIADPSRQKGIIAEVLDWIHLDALLEAVCAWLQLPRLESTWSSVAGDLFRTRPALYAAAWEAACEQQGERGGRSPDNPSPPKAARTADTADTADALAQLSTATPPEAAGAPAAAAAGEDAAEAPALEPGAPLEALPPALRRALVAELYVALTREFDGALEASARQAVAPPSMGDKTWADKVEARHKFVQDAKQRGHLPGQYEAAWQQVYVGYQRELRERNALDLADLLLSLHALLRRDQRVLSRLRIRYRYLLVDEAQDLNPIQLAVAGMLSAGGRVTAVGDDDQAIYGWRGGEPWTLDAFHQLHVGANPQLLRCLEINYRSTAPILAAAQVVLARNARPRPKVLRPPPPPPGAPPPPPPPPVVVAEAGTPQDEAAWIADRIEEHAAAGVPFAQQAVLFRFFRWGGTAYGPLKAELDRRNIPNKLLRERTLMKRAAVQHAMAYLRLALDPHDDDAFRVAVNVPPKGVGPAALASLEQSQRECRARGRRRSLFECAGRVGGAGEVAQALRGVRRLLLGLSRAAMHMRPAEVLYEALRASGYVAWADAESARAHFVGDGALSEVEDDEDDYASEGDEEEEAQDAAAEAALGEAEEDGSDDDGGAGGDEEVVPGRRRRRAPAPAPAPDATAAAPARAPPRPRPRDPLAPYGFDLSGFRARCSPLRRLLREAALFSQTWTYGDNAAEAGFAAGRGPPSLFRAAYVAALAAPGGAAATALGGDAQEHGARLGLGPLVLAEFLSFVQEADSEGASAVDRNNVTLSTIHSAKGLEWPVVFCARWNQGFTPSNYWVRDDAPPEPGPPAEPTLPGFRPPVGVDPAAAHAEEERRLAHVAVTRARRHLYISYFRYKPFYNKARPEHASELALDVVEALSLRPGAPAVRAVKLPESPAERALIRRGVSFPLWWNGAQPQWLP